MSIKIYQGGSWVESATATSGYTKAEADTKFADKATTLAGYGITDAYTKTGADTKFAAKATTLSGYGITDAYTKTQANTLFGTRTGTLSITAYYTNWSADTSSRYVNKCYKLNDYLYFITIFVKCSTALTAGSSYTVIDAGNIKIDSKIPYTSTLTGVDRATQRAVGVWINYQGKIYISPTAAVSASDGIVISGVVYVP